MKKLEAKTNKKLIKKAPMKKTESKNVNFIEIFKIKTKEFINSFKNNEEDDSKKKRKIILLLLLFLFIFSIGITYSFGVFDTVQENLIEVFNLHKPTSPEIKSSNTWVKSDVVKVVKDAKVYDGLDYYEYCVSTKDSTKECSWEKTTTKSVVLSVTGKYYVTFRAVDKEGRIGYKSNTVIARSTKDGKVISSSSFTITKVDSVEPTIELDIPDFVTLGESYLLPTSYKVGTSGGTPTCKIGDTKYTNLKDVIIGTHTLECSITNGAGMSGYISKTIIINEDLGE